MITYLFLSTYHFTIFFKFQVGLGVWGEDSTTRESPNSFYNQVQQQREVGSSNNQQQPKQNHQNQQIQSAPPTEEMAKMVLQDDTGFVKPKANEKKDKKAKRAEEKKRQREQEAKKAKEANEYIPGMEGSVRPQDDENDFNEDVQQIPYVSDPFLSFNLF